MAEVVAAGVVRLWEILVRFDGRFMVLFSFSTVASPFHLFTESNIRTIRFENEEGSFLRIPHISQADRDMDFLIVRFLIAGQWKWKSEYCDKSYCIHIVF